MEYRSLGTTGCKVSSISLGSWLTYGAAVDQEITNACVHTAWEYGINFFDTADIYNKGKAETALAAALKDLERREYVLASKVFFPMSDNVNDRGLSRKHIFESCHRSLRRLDTEYLDLYQCHRFDPETPVAEVVRAMDDLIRQGKVLYWGVSFWNAAQITEACLVADKLGADRPVTNQPPYSLLDRRIEQDVMATSARFGMKQIIYSPLAQGVLTGKYLKGQIPARSRASHAVRGKFVRPKLTEENAAKVERIRDVALELGFTPAQLALAWVLQRPEVSSAIIGATAPAQIVENLGALECDMPAGAMKTLDELKSDHADGS